MTAASARARIAVLPGDGIGPEVTDAAVRVLGAAAERSGHIFTFDTRLIGGAAIDDAGTSLPDATVDACARADAILLGAVGGPKWSDPGLPVRPEQGLLEIRRHFELFANLRPVRVSKALVEAAPLRPERLRDVDLVIFRELTGGLYFGPRREQGAGEGEDDTAWDTLIYSESEVERIARLAFDAARGRRRRVASVDKANVLASMRLWRRVVTRVAADYPDVELEHVLVDAAAMRLITRPASFDVVLAGNLFGDILSDAASVLSGSLGMLPSASLSASGRGLYEPVHGSAPDIAGRGVANPIGAILSAAMLLRHSLGLSAEAGRVEAAVERALGDGVRTADLGGGDDTETMTRAVLDKLADG
ncbi:MAG: 3-isopropylmalate dehydrogenase [Acidobacteriota bacterium]